MSALEQLKSQLEQQLQIERDACAQEGALRRQLEAAVSKAQRSTAEAQEAAAQATQGAQEAHAALEKAAAAQRASEEQLRIANEKSLTQYMEQEAGDDAMKQLKQLRQDVRSAPRSPRRHLVTQSGHHAVAPSRRCSRVNHRSPHALPNRAPPQDQDKLLRAANDRAQLVQQVHGLEDRLQAAMAAQDKAADEFHRQRYELQS